MKVLVLNGPNLNLLGQRDQTVYGGKTLSEINAGLKAEADKLGLLVEFYQSNSEGELVDQIQAFDGGAIVINAGAYSHYSLAVADALRDCKKLKIEVHLSNIFAREEFRRTSVLSPVCDGIISGFGEQSYVLALRYLSARQ